MNYQRWAVTLPPKQRTFADAYRKWLLETPKDPTSLPDYADFGLAMDEGFQVSSAIQKIEGFRTESGLPTRANETRNEIRPGDVA